MFEQASQEYLRRLAAIWTSPLSIPRKVKPQTRLLTQFCNIICGQEEDLQELYRKTRAVIPQNKGKHNSESSPTLYLSPDLGGRGLIEIDENLVYQRS